MIPRWIGERLQKWLQVMPVVFLQGARQVGKTTLAMQLMEEGVMNAYFSFDDLTLLQAAQRDPKGFVDTLPERAVIDEVQRVPQVLLPLKARIDANRKAGMFLLTGSANPLTLPQVADALVGRMAVLTLYPLSQGEMEGVREIWLVRAFEGRWQITSMPTADLWFRVVRGGYPEAVRLHDPTARRLWLRAYADTLITRDVNLLADIERTADMASLLQLLAALSGQLLNLSSLSREMGMPHSTLQRYLKLLERLMVIVRVPAWHAHAHQQLLKTPKILMNDTGLAIALLNLDEPRLLSDNLLRGRMLENFVGMELLKQISYAAEPYRLYHLRTSKGREVDFLLEDAQGRLLGIEVKASTTVSAEDFRHLRAVGEWLGARWAGGILLYTGTTLLPFGEQLWAMPISCLWQIA
jgi:predicted AAA+ superfamily ATPase